MQVKFCQDLETGLLNLEVLLPYLNNPSEKAISKKSHMKHEA